MSDEGWPAHMADDGSVCFALAISGRTPSAVERTLRDAEIVWMHASGWPRWAIAKACGISIARIGQIVQQARIARQAR